MPYKDQKRAKQYYKQWKEENRQKCREDWMSWFNRNYDTNRVKSTTWQRDRKAKKFGTSYPTWWLCNSCSKPISLNKGEIYLDHNHKTGKFRAWLCFKCNTLLGYLDALQNWQIEQLLSLVD